MQPHQSKAAGCHLPQVIDLIGGGFGAASALGYEDGDVRFLGVAPSRQRRRQQAGAQQPVGAANEQPADAPAALRAPGLLSQPELAAEDVARLGAGRLDRDAMPIADGMSCSQVEHGGVLEEQQVAAQQVNCRSWRCLCTVAYHSISTNAICNNCTCTICHNCLPAAAAVHKSASGAACGSATCFTQHATMT